MPLGDGTFCVCVTKAVQAQAGASVGDTVAVAVDRDVGERTVDVPPDLAAALASRPVNAAWIRRSARSLLAPSCPDA